MKLNKHLIPMVLVLALVLGVAGCKNDSAPATDDKSYIVDPGDGKLPDTSPNPCVAKDAAGAMELLLKGKCDETAKPPACGNYKLEDGEQCDPPDGKVCNVKCQKIVAGAPAQSGGTASGSSTPSSINIMTEKIKDGRIGQDYSSEAIVATGKKAGDNYTWSAVSVPDGFELKTVGEGGKIASKGAAKAGNHTATVRVCLKSDAKACAERSFSFSIKDELNLAARRSTGAKPSCESTGSPCAALNLDAKTHFSGFVNKNGPKFVLIFNVTSLVKDHKNFQWGLSYTDGGTTKDLPVVKATDQLLCNPLIRPEGKGIDASCGGKEQHFPEGIFLMEPKHGEGAGTYQRHYLMAGPTAFGKTHANVTVTVKNEWGGVQKLAFSTITLPKLEDLQAQQASAAQAKEQASAAQAIKCSDMVVKGLVIDGQTHFLYGSDLATKTYKFNLTGQRIDKAYEATLEMGGGNGAYKLSNLTLAVGDTSSQISGNPVIDGMDIQWPKYQKASPAAADTTTFDVSDTAADCVQTAHIVIQRTLRYPALEEQKVSDLKSIKVSMGVLDVEDQSKFTIILLDQNGNELAKTAAISAGDRTDPAVYNETYPLSVVKDAPLSSFVKIKVFIQDPGMGGYMDAWLYGYSVSTQYGAIYAGDLSAYVKWSGLFDEMWTIMNTSLLGHVEAGGTTGSFTVDVNASQWTDWPSVVVP